MAANHDLEMEIQQLRHQLNEAKFRAESTAVATRLASDTALNTLQEANKRIVTVRKQRDETLHKLSATQDRVSTLEKDLTLANARIKELESDPPLPEIGVVLENFSTSFWLRESLEKALERYAVDAANDAELLALLLRKRVEEAL